MPLTERASLQTVDQVLRKIAATIADDPERFGVRDKYFGDSCYGKVAIYMKNHPKLTHAYIMLFALSLDYEDIVSHAVLVTEHGHRLVDSFGGHIKNVNGRPVFEHEDRLHPGQPYQKPLLASINVEAFRTKYGL